MIAANHERLLRDDPFPGLVSIGKTLAAAYHPTIEEPLPRALMAIALEVERAVEKASQAPVKAERQRLFRTSVGLAKW